MDASEVLGDGKAVGANEDLDVGENVKEDIGNGEAGKDVNEDIGDGEAAKDGTESEDDLGDELAIDVDGAFEVAVKENIYVFNYPKCSIL